MEPTEFAHAKGVEYAAQNDKEHKKNLSILIGIIVEFSSHVKTMSYNVGLVRKKIKTELSVHHL